MLIARLSDGSFIIGIDANNIRKLREGKPMVVDLFSLGGTDRFMLAYGETLGDIIKELKDAGMELPPAQALPKQGKPS